MKETWEISKEFGFDYGHRVWSQELNKAYSLDNKTVCRHLHGHRGKVHIHLKACQLVNGMCTDFKHLNWAKVFIDSHIDHKFILDINDPMFNSITMSVPEFDDGKLINLMFNNKAIPVVDVTVPGTDFVAGQALDLELFDEGPDKEMLESFFIVNFLPTSENLSKWLWECIHEKMHLINVTTSKIEWWETPKSCSVYSGPSE